MLTIQGVEIVLSIDYDKWLKLGFKFDLVVETQTPEAINFDGWGWVPKSQLRIFSTKAHEFVYIAKWWAKQEGWDVEYSDGK